MDNNDYHKQEQLNRLIDFVEESRKQFDSQKAYDLFEARMQSGLNKLPLYKTFNHYIYAAILTTFVFLSYFTYQQLMLPSYQESFLSEVKVPNGSKTKLVLQDGTKVWVNSGSTILCEKNYRKNIREICLSGEVYMEVAHMEDCPFIISAGDVKVKVLGTKFNISAYQENEVIKVSLLEGSVEMTTCNDAPFLLAPKDVAYYNTKTGQVSIRNNVTDNMTSWLNNELYFEGETFEQIIRTLERNYNVKINIHKSSIKERRFGGDFANNETIEQIFEVMSLDGKFKYRIEGNVIDIY